MKKVLIVSSTKLVDNIIEWEENSTWQPPEGCELVDFVSGANPGDTLDAGVLTKQPREAVVNPLQTELDTATTTEAKLAILAKALGLEI